MKKAMQFVWTVYGIIAVIAGIICIRDYHRAMRELNDSYDDDDDATT